mgnify:CR=1 FL=1
MEQTIFAVSEVNEYIKNMLDTDERLNALFIRGELSNYKVYPSGHHYFTLKDETGALRCVMFRSSAVRLRFRPENGMKVIAFGRITVFPRDGAYQLYCADLTPDGVGDLHVAFEQLKEKLNLPNMKVIATGGLARVIDPKGEIFDVLDPVLTLKGLRILYEKNK